MAAKQTAVAVTLPPPEPRHGARPNPHQRFDRCSDEPRRRKTASPDGDSAGIEQASKGLHRARCRYGSHRRGRANVARGIGRTICQVAPAKVGAAKTFSQKKLTTHGQQLFTGRHGESGGSGVLSVRRAGQFQSPEPYSRKSGSPRETFAGQRLRWRMRRGLNSLVISTREGANRIVRFPLHLLF